MVKDETQNFSQIILQDKIKKKGKHFSLTPAGNGRQIEQILNVFPSRNIRTKCVSQKSASTILTPGSSMSTFYMVFKKNPKLRVRYIKIWRKYKKGRKVHESKKFKLLSHS